MKLSKVWIILIIAVLLVNVLTLSYIVANKKAQYDAYMMTRMDYINIVMDIHANSYTARHQLDLSNVALYAGDADSEVHMEITWGKDTKFIGELENAVRDAFVNILAAELKLMYQLGNWESNPLILCVQKIGYDEVDKIQKRVSTAGAEVLRSPSKSHPMSNTKPKLPGSTPKGQVQVLRNESNTVPRSVQTSNLVRLTADSMLFSDEPDVWLKYRGKRVVVTGRVSFVNYHIVTLTIGDKSVECVMVNDKSAPSPHQVITIEGTVEMTNENLIRLKGCVIK